jgi:hypothetical protein
MPRGTLDYRSVHDEESDQPWRELNAARSFRTGTAVLAAAINLFLLTVSAYMSINSGQSSSSFSLGVFVSPILNGILLLTCIAMAGYLYPGRARECCGPVALLTAGGIILNLCIAMRAAAIF